MLVQRANVLLEIKDEDKKYYMNQGYSVVDEDGNIVEEALSKDVATLQKEVLSLRAKLAKFTEKPKVQEDTEPPKRNGGGRPRKDRD